MKITTIGIDLAKEVFQIHGVDKHGKMVLRKQLRRNKMTKLGKFGHTVKLMSTQFVKPYVKTSKHDMADAEAICEAVSRPNMRFVSIKNVEQQSMICY